jgi:hypothetical protein
VYVFHELVSLKRDVKKGGTNKVVIEDYARLRLIGANAGKLWREFQQRAGIPVGFSDFFVGEIKNKFVLPPVFQRTGKLEGEQMARLTARSR